MDEKEKASELTLKIVTPKGTQAPVSCDSIHLTVRDNSGGKGGGSYGIRPGHAKALLSLEKGEIEALNAGKVVLKGQCGHGFATVNQNLVTVAVESFSRSPKEETTF